jgi:hypothetical protein
MVERFHGKDERETWLELAPDILSALAILVAVALLVGLAWSPDEIIAAAKEGRRYADAVW